MNGLLLDTHVWLWFLIGSARLSEAAKEAITHEDTSIWLSPLSVWELTVLVRKRRFEVDGDVQAFIDRAFAALPVRSASVDVAAARLADGLDLPQQDPVDRLLAATALSRHLRLVTADRSLRQAPWLDTVW